MKISRYIGRSLAATLYKKIKEDGRLVGEYEDSFWEENTSRITWVGYLRIRQDTFEEFESIPNYIGKFSDMFEPDVTVYSFSKTPKQKVKV